MIASAPRFVVDSPEQCCGVYVPAPLPGRIGIMFARLVDLPAVPSLGRATPKSRTDVHSGPLYGAQEFPVARARARAMLFRAGAESDWKTLVETAETGAVESHHRIADGDCERFARSPKERHGPPDLDRRPPSRHLRAASDDARQDTGGAR